jgi:hypothetical protein
MRLRVIASVCLSLCFVAGLIAQEGGADPLSGIWFGYYGTNPRDQNQVQVALRWDGKALTGTVSTGDDPIDLENATFEPSTGAVHMEAIVPGRGRSTYHYMIDGKLDNGTISGLWHHENGRGDFKITKL